jgi:hypothetical protein
MNPMNSTVYVLGVRDRDEQKVDAVYHDVDAAMQAFFDYYTNCPQWCNRRVFVIDDVVTLFESRCKEYGIGELLAWDFRDEAYAVRQKAYNEAAILKNKEEQKNQAQVAKRQYSFREILQYAGDSSLLTGAHKVK